MRNRRGGVRMETHRPAHLATPDGAVVRNCTLRNISARGARLTVTDPADLPERLTLHLPEEGVSWPCRIVRRREGEVGVLFV